MNPQPTVFLIDDEPAVRDSVRWLVESLNYPVESFSSAQEFLDAYSPERPGCLLLDLRLPGMDGLELQDRLLEQEIQLPIIIISGHADVPMAVRAMKRGAFDLLEKPFPDDVLLDRVKSAIEHDLQLRKQRKLRQESFSRLSRLSPREYQVMELVVAGKQNKIIAAELGVSPKTVEAHRSNVMEKMQAGSLAELVRMVMATGGPLSKHRPSTKVRRRGAPPKPPPGGKRRPVRTRF